MTSRDSLDRLIQVMLIATDVWQRFIDQEISRASGEPLDHRYLSFDGNGPSTAKPRKVCATFQILLAAC